VAPQAADTVRRIDVIESDAALFQGVGHSQADRTRADNE